MRINITKKAEEDLENIWKFTSKNWSTEQADKYYNLIMDEIEKVSYNIDRGKSINHIRLAY